MGSNIFFHISCIFALFLVQCAHMQNTTNSSSSTTTKSPQVPILDLTQILAIGNPSAKNSLNRTTTSTTPASTTVPIFTHSTTTTTTTTSTTTVKVTEAITSSTTPSTTSTTSTTPVTEVATESTEATTELNEVETTTLPPLPNDNLTLLSEDVPQVAPEALRESTTTTTTTTEATTTTKAPEPIRLGPIVKIGPGELRPAILKSRGGRRYYAFKGVPYASPPDQFQRFKDPGPVAPWSNILNASGYGPSCIQYNILSEEVEGEEDCLTLNIFTNAVKLSLYK